MKRKKNLPTTSTHSPKFEKYAKVSCLSLAPTTIALGAELGDPSHALHPLLPLLSFNNNKTK